MVSLLSIDFNQFIINNKTATNHIELLNDNHYYKEVLLNVSPINILVM